MIGLQTTELVIAGQQCECPACELPIIEGELILKLPCGDWIHAKCAEEL